MEISFIHDITDAEDLKQRLHDLTRDPRILEHLSQIQRGSSGLRYRFSGPRVPGGSLEAQVATAQQLGFITLELELSGLAKVFKGAVESSIRTAAAEVLGQHLVRG